MAVFRDFDSNNNYGMRGLNPGTVRRLFRAIADPVRAVSSLLRPAFQYSVIRHRASKSLAAENLFLRKQLTLFQEREIKPRRADVIGAPEVVRMAGPESAVPLGL